MSKEQFSFNKGWSQVKNGDISECRAKLMAALNINTRMAFLNRLKGEVEPKVSEVVRMGRKQERHCETPFHFGTDGGKSCPEHIRENRVFQSQ